jgi:predicted Rossmann fold flavoprotein
MIDMKEKNTVLIIGGGAAGMIAAIAARRNGADVTILERNSRIGRKILATGNGRCNLTNVNIDVSKYHGRNPKFIYGAISRFNYDMTIDFFESLGIAPKVEDEGKVFPMSGQASSVLDVLRYEIESNEVNVVCDANVYDVQKKKQFEATISGGKTYRGERVILCTGGKASPNLGSNGSGYALAERLGHSAIEPFPALVQLKLNALFLKSVMGVKFEGRADVVANGKVLRSESGEILFTEYGISGPPILQLSRTAGEHVLKGDKVFIRLDLVESTDEEELKYYLIERFSRCPKKTFSFALVGFINKRLIPVVLKQAGIGDINKPCKNISENECSKIAHILKDWELEVTGTNLWSSAQVTAGGINVNEIESRTMESKLVPGLYFAGEIVDIDGDCGGYNLQWAWSSGYLAGESAAKSLKHDSD